jgi:putative oxidoreductase
MKKLMSTKYSKGGFNIAMLLLRLILGFLIMSHGFEKLLHFSENKNNFMNFMGIGSSMSLALVIFAEFFCALFLIIGLLTRGVVIPLIITMLVALFKAHHLDFMGEGEMATLYLGGFLALLILGPGRVSIDGMTGN